MQRVYMIGTLAALVFYVLAIALPDPAPAALSDDLAVAGAVATPVPHRLTGECFTVEWFLEKGYELAAEEGWVLSHWLVEDGAKTTLTFMILGSPDMLEHTFLDGCHVSERFIPP